MYGYRARIGYTSPRPMSEQYVWEFYQMAPKGVTLMVSTSVVQDVTTEELEACYRHGCEVARIMAKAGASAVILGCGGANLIHGPKGVDDFIKGLEDEFGIPAITSASAQMHALQAVGAHRIAELCPRADLIEGNQRKWDYYASFGFDLVGVKYQKVTSFLEHGKVDPEDTLQLAREMIQEFPDADSYLVPGPQIPFLPNVEILEQETGKNVVCSVQAHMWEALRRIEINDSIPGFGRLLREC